MALIDAVKKQFSKYSQANTETPKRVPFDIRDWLEQYANRDKSRADGKANDAVNRGIKLRQSLSASDLSCDYALVLYIVCKGDRNVLAELDKKIEQYSYTAQDMIRVIHSDAGYELMEKYTKKIRDLARQGK